MEGSCRKHPNRRPSPGVCSLCLKERLAYLSASCKPSASTSATSLSPSSSSSFSPSLDREDDDSSTFSIPISWPTEEEKKSISYLISKEGRLSEKSAGRIWPLRRSRSAAVEAVKPEEEEKKKKKGSGGGGGLWSLLLLKGKKEVVGREEKASKWRFSHSVKVVKDGIFVGVR